MIVAVIGVGVVEVTFDDVVGVVAVRDRVMTACRAVDVVFLVARARVLGRAVRRIRRSDRDGVVVHVVAVHVVQVAVVEEILVAVVLDLLVAAVWSVLVVVAFVRLVVVRHGVLLPELIVVFVLVNVAQPLGCMLDRALDQVADVRVGERVEDVFSGAPPRDDALGA